MAEKLVLNPDRLFPAGSDATWHRPPPLCRGQGPAHHQPARTHQTGMVRRKPAVSGPDRTVRDSRPLYLPHALFGRHHAGPTRHPAGGRRLVRNRSAQGMAPVRRELPSVPRHADPHLDGSRLLRDLRHRGPAFGRDGGTPSTTRSRPSSARPNTGRANCSTASTSKPCRPPTSPGIPCPITRRSSTATGTPASFPRSGRTRSPTPNSRASRRTSSAWARSPERTSPHGRAT